MTETQPMINVPPPTPITAADNLSWVIADIDRAIEIYKSDRAVDNTPLWSTLHSARRHATEALAKISAARSQATGDQTTAH